MHWHFQNAFKSSLDAPMWTGDPTSPVIFLAFLVQWLWLYFLHMKADLLRPSWPELFGRWLKKVSGFLLTRTFLSTVTASSHIGLDDCIASSFLVAEGANSLLIHALLETWHSLPALFCCSLSVCLIAECMNKQIPGAQNWCGQGIDSPQGEGDVGVVGRLKFNTMDELKMHVSVSGKKKKPLETTPRSLAKKLIER